MECLADSGAVVRVRIRAWTSPPLKPPLPHRHRSTRRQFSTRESAVVVGHAVAEEFLSVVQDLGRVGRVLGQVDELVGVGP